MKKPSSKVRIRSSKANGALSRGPKTPKGKLRSAGNRLTHGLYSNQIVLKTESPYHFAALLRGQLDGFQSRNAIEREAVIDIAITRWRIRRLWTVEAGLFNLALGQDQASYQTGWKLAEACPAVNRISIIEDRYQRQLHADLRAFQGLRKLSAQANKNFAHSNPLNEILIPGSTYAISSPCDAPRPKKPRPAPRKNAEGSPQNHPETTRKQPDSDPICEGPDANSA